jgi:hypothetical protein
MHSSVPARGALTAVSIFIASSVAITSPASTCSPDSRCQRTRLPVSGASTSPGSAVAAAGDAAGGAAAGTDAQRQPGRQAQPQAPPVDLDEAAHHRGAIFGIGPRRGLEAGLHLGLDPARVHLKAILGGKGRVGDHRAVEGQHRGHALDLETRRSARRARASAWSRVAPVTMSLAISESKLPGTGAGCHARVQRTPGPPGASKR